MIWRFGRHFALVVLVCVVAGKREISLCVVPGGGHFVLVLYVWYAKYVDLSRGKTNEVPIVHQNENDENSGLYCHWIPSKRQK